MKYFKFTRSTMAVLVCLSIMTIYSIFIHNLLSLVLGGVSIYLLLKNANYERIIDLSEAERERLRKIIHIFQMRSRNNEN